jgi:hypothetical protein
MPAQVFAIPRPPQSRRNVRCQRGDSATDNEQETIKNICNLTNKKNEKTKENIMDGFVCNHSLVWFCENLLLCRKHENKRVFIAKIQIVENEIDNQTCIDNCVLNYRIRRCSSLFF